jgi:hypothetical protein
MLTTVRRDILDKSISGNKIFGGIINYIDGLHTTDINVPQGAAAPSAGTGLIDGLGVLIGSRSKIGNVQSNIVGAHATLGLRRAAQPTEYSFITQEVGTGARILLKRTVSGGVTRIQLHAGNQSYFLDKLMVGRSTETQSGVAFETPTAVIDELLWTSAGGQQAQIGLIQTLDPNDEYVMLSDIIGKVYDLEDIILNGTDLIEPLKTLVDGMTADQALQLCNIIDTPPITSENWGILPSLNQELSTSSSPAFEGVYVGAVPSEVGAPTNFLSDYKEWLAVPLVMEITNWAAIKANVLVDIVKCGKLVTICVRASNVPRNHIILTNGTGGTRNGAAIITLSDPVYAPILLSNSVGSPGLILMTRAFVNGSIESCNISPPFVDVPQIYISKLGESPSLFSINNGNTFEIYSFSFSYIVS